MKLSEITAANVAEYLRLDEYNEEEITTIMTAVRAYIRSYTGLKDESMDEIEEMYIAFMVLCQDAYDNRSFLNEKNSVNRVVETILGMHSVNLL